MLLAIIVIMMEEVKQQCNSHCNMIIPSVLKLQHTKCLTVLSYVTHPVLGAIHSVNTLYVQLCLALSILKSVNIPQTLSVPNTRRTLCMLTLQNTP